MADRRPKAPWVRDPLRDAVLGPRPSLARRSLRMFVLRPLRATPALLGAGVGHVLVGACLFLGISLAASRLAPIQVTCTARPTMFQLSPTLAQQEARP